MVGEGAGLVDQVRPAGEIVKELAEEAVAVLGAELITSRDKQTRCFSV